MKMVNSLKKYLETTASSTENDPTMFEVSVHSLHFVAAAVGVWDDLESDHEGHVRWQLPAYVSVEVLPPEASTECFIIATLDKQEWNRGDGLTVCGCGNRTDFDFRTKVFGKFPQVQRHANVRLNPKTWNTMDLALSETRAVYFINGIRVATMLIRPGELPSPTPFIGMYGFSSPYKARNFRVQSLKPQILTMAPCLPLSQGQSRIACTNLAGEEVCCLEFQADSGMTPNVRQLLELAAQNQGKELLLIDESLENYRLITIDGRLIPFLSLNSLVTDV